MAKEITKYDYEHKDDPEEKECEKCGGELSNRLYGDETYDYCRDCKHITH